MSKNQKASGITNIINYDNSGNISFVSGSTTLMSVSSSGAVLLTGTMSGGTADSASLSANSNLLQGTGSIGFATTASLLAVSSSQQQISASLLTLTASYTALSSSYTALSGSYTTFSGSASTRITVDSASLQQISASLLNVVANYATTGSNSFRANQSITGSLVVSSTITAQTLVVQTVTSSIVYSSGSNIFGSALSNTQTFTGSIYQTGSIAAFAGSVGIGTTNPSNKLTVRGTDSTSMLYLGISGASANGEAVGITFGSATYDKARIVAYNENSGNAAGYLTLWTGGSPTTTDITERMRITSAGKVGIGTTQPSYTLDVAGTGRFTGQLIASSTSGGTAAIFQNTGAQNSNGIELRGGTTGTTVNWKIEKDNTVSNAFQLTPSTTNGGSTYTTPVLTIASTGEATFNGTVNVYDASSHGLSISNSSGAITFTNNWSKTTFTVGSAQDIEFNDDGGVKRLMLKNGGNVGIGTTSPFVVFDVRQPYAKTDTTRRDILYASNDAVPSGLRISITGGASQAVRTSHLQTTEWGVGNDGIISLQPFGGKVGIGITNPTKLFEVNGRMSTPATVSTNLIAGNIASNMPSSPAYIPIFNLAEAAGMSLVGFVNAASYTCFNISQIYIKKEYSGTGITAGITGLYKLSCDFSIVNITYSGVTYVALRFTSNPEIDVMWTGYLLNYAFNSDGSAQVWTSGVTLNSTYATY